MIRITDHALLRWLERAHDIDVEFFRNKLAELVEPHANLPPKRVEIGGLWFIFNGKVLTTVVPNKPKPWNTAKHDRENHNGAGKFGEPLHWKAKNRRRDHR